MYNRYIPQSDGTYQRKRIQDVSSTIPSPAKLQPPEQPAPPPYSPPEPPRRHTAPSRPRPRPYHEPESSITAFFKQLLPRDFDTGDLLVILLLLLMSGDCQEDQNTALLTLALYLFM